MRMLNSKAFGQHSISIFFSYICFLPASRFSSQRAVNSFMPKERIENKSGKAAGKSFYDSEQHLKQT